MKIAIGSDGQSNLTDSVVKHVKNQGHEVVLWGALGTGSPRWTSVARAVAEGVSNGAFDGGILFCWTGTGITIAANKVRGIRAALCTDAETARGARKWNDANILTLSLRTTSEVVAREIVDAWFTTEASTDAEDLACFRELEALDEMR